MNTITTKATNDLPLSFHEIVGKELTVKNSKSVNFASGQQKYYNVFVNGKEVEVPERFTK